MKWYMKVLKKMMKPSNTLVRETDGMEAPIKNPKTIPIMVVIISLAPSLLDFLKTPLTFIMKTKKIPFF